MADDLDETQDALDGVDRGHAVVGPGRVVEVQNVLALVGLRGATERTLKTGTTRFNGVRQSHRLLADAEGRTERVRTGSTPCASRR